MVNYSVVFFLGGGVTFCVDSFRLGRRSLMRKAPARPSCVHFFFLSFFLVCGTAVHSFSSGSATSIFLRVQHGSNLGECCCRILVTSWKHADVCRDDRSSNSRRNGGRKKMRKNRQDRRPTWLNMQS